MNTYRQNQRPTRTRSNQLRLFPIRKFAGATMSAPHIETWRLSDLRALAIDPEVETRRLVALSRLTIDVGLQNVLACDPDETVVLNLLSVVDAGVEAAEMILTGPHTRARRILGRQNLRTELLLLAVDDPDDEVRRAVRARLESRGVRVTWTTGSHDAAVADSFDHTGVR